MRKNSIQPEIVNSMERNNDISIYVYALLDQTSTPATSNTQEVQTFAGFGTSFACSSVIV